MTVYVVQVAEPEPPDVLGVFGSVATAMDAFPGEWRGSEEPGLWTRPRRRGHPCTLTIEAYEVRR